jgi:hypothetical protein
LGKKWDESHQRDCTPTADTLISCFSPAKEEEAEEEEEEEDFAYSMIL